MSINTIKKTVSIFLCLIIMFTLFPTINATAENKNTYRLGDLTGDSRITVEDALLCLRAAVKIKTLSKEQEKAADVFDNGRITLANARRILRAAVGIEPLEESNDAFTPQLKIPAILSAEQNNNIKEIYLKYLHNQAGYPEATINDFSIILYCGTYNGLTVVMIYDNLKNNTPTFEEENLDGITFSYGIQNCILISKEETILNLKSAYEQGLLTYSDLKNIAFYQKELEVFKDDKVVVVLKNYYSLNKKLYTSDDFPEFDVESIEAVYDLENSPWIKKESFNQILYLTLKTKNKGYVLWVASLLEKRDDVVSAEPIYNLIPLSN